MRSHDRRSKKHGRERDLSIKFPRQQNRAHFHRPAVSTLALRHLLLRNSNIYISVLCWRLFAAKYDQNESGLWHNIRPLCTCAFQRLECYKRFTSSGTPITLYGVSVRECIAFFPFLLAKHIIPSYVWASFRFRAQLFLHGRKENLKLWNLIYWRCAHPSSSCTPNVLPLLDGHFPHEGVNFLSKLPSQLATLRKSPKSGKSE